jgi:hypothetical protein
MRPATFEGRRAGETKAFSNKRIKERYKAKAARKARKGSKR